MGNHMEDKVALHSLLEKQGNIFSRRLIKVMRISECTEAPQQLLQNLAATYQNRIELRLKSMSARHEAILMVVLGIIIGTLVIAMYLPIFKLGSAVG